MMETDENGLIKVGELLKRLRGKGWIINLAGLQDICQAQHDHDVAMVRGIPPVNGPYNSATPEYQAGEEMRRAILAALKAKEA